MQQTLTARANLYQLLQQLNSNQPIITMAEYDNTNTGTFFVNDRKEKPNQPDYNGKIDVEGKTYYLKGWKKVAKSGLSFMSLAVNPADAPASTSSSAPAAATVPASDDSPF